MERVSTLAFCLGLGEPRAKRKVLLCYNLSSSGWRYRLGVRTEDSQSSNPGSIPGSATNLLILILPLNRGASSGLVAQFNTESRQ